MSSESPGWRARTICIVTLIDHRSSNSTCGANNTNKENIFIGFVLVVNFDVNEEPGYFCCFDRLSPSLNCAHGPCLDKKG